MIETISLTARAISPQMPDYIKIKNLYRKAFPRKERFPNIVLQMMMRLKIVKALAFYDEKQLCGFCYLLVQDKTVFIMYLAVHDKLRGRGYGSRILDFIKLKYSDKKITLDVEAVDKWAENYEQRISRVKFYKRNGFYQTNQYFSMRGVRYEIMSTDAAEKG